MVRVEVDIPDRVDAQLESLVEEESSFVSRDQAAEELIQMGLQAYRPETEGEEAVGMDESGYGEF